VAAGIEHLRKAASKVPDSAEWKAELYFHLGSAEATAGARAAALAAYQKYMTLAPADAPSRPEVEKQIRRLGGK
jgi:cytochrome c-type biogenesis protein CcmH/NrfG